MQQMTDPVCIFHFSLQFDSIGDTSFLLEFRREENVGNQRKEKQNNHHNLSLGRMIDSHPNPLSAELFYSADTDLKLAGEPQHGHSPSETFPC